MPESDGAHTTSTAISEAMWFTGKKAQGQADLGLTPALVDSPWCGSDQVT